MKSHKYPKNKEHVLKFLDSKIHYICFNLRRPTVRRTSSICTDHLFSSRRTTHIYTDHLHGEHLFNLKLGNCNINCSKICKELVFKAEDNKNSSYFILPTGNVS